MVRLGKPRITGMVIITFLGGLWLAPGDIAHWRTIMTLIGTALLVAASNALNMYLERDVDALMERTRDRPLPRAIGLARGGAGVRRRRWPASASPLVFLGSNLLTGLLGLLAIAGYVGGLHAAEAHSRARRCSSAPCRARCRRSWAGRR